MRTCFLLVALSFALMSAAQFPYNPLPYKQSDFKKIKELGYTKLFICQETGEEKHIATEVEYGKDGLIAAVFEKGTNDNGDSINIGETYYKFDGKGRMISEESRHQEYGESRSVYTYDAAGKLIRKQTATIDPPTYTYQYDAKGRLAQVYVTQRMPVYDKDGEWKGKTVEKPSTRSVFKYDAKGRLSEEWIYYLPSEKTDPATYKIIWTYNEKNQVVQVKRVNSEGTEMNRENYEYNKDGLVSKAIINDGGEDEVLNYEYSKGCKRSLD